MTALGRETGNYVEDDSKILTLPSPAELPNANVVIYDGQCNFCKAQVQRLNWFANGRLAFVSLHDSSVPGLVPDLSKDDLMEQMYVVDGVGKSHGGAAGIRYLSRILPRLWFAAPLLHVPFSLPLWQFFYSKIAKHRYLISGRSAACENDSCEFHARK